MEEKKCLFCSETNSNTPALSDLVRHKGRAEQDGNGKLLTAQEQTFLKNKELVKVQGLSFK